MVLYLEAHLCPKLIHLSLEDTAELGEPEDAEEAVIMTITIEHQVAVGPLTQAGDDELNHRQHLLRKYLLLARRLAIFQRLLIHRQVLLP